MANIKRLGVPKRVCGNELTATMLVQLVTCYIDSINEGGVPNISSAWENVVASQGHAAQRLAEKAYLDMMREGTSHGCVELHELFELHGRAKAVAKAELLRSALAPDVLQPFADAHKQMMRQRLSEFRARNDEVSRTNCEALLRVAKCAELPMLGEAVRTYNSEAAGPSKHRLLCEFLTVLLHRAITI